MNEQIIKERAGPVDHRREWIDCKPGFWQPAVFFHPWPGQPTTSPATLQPAAFITASPTAQLLRSNYYPFPPTDTVILSLATPTSIPTDIDSPDAADLHLPRQRGPDFT